MVYEVVTIEYFNLIGVHEINELHVYDIDMYVYVCVCV